MTNNAEMKKPADLDLHCLQRHDTSGFSRTRVSAQDDLDSKAICPRLLFDSYVSVNCVRQCVLILKIISYLYVLNEILKNL